MYKTIGIVFSIMILFAGCATRRMDLPEPPPPPQIEKNPNLIYIDDSRISYRTRRPIPMDQSRYEGSLWKDESSWGNLLRDHRARFRDDVLMITNIQNILNIPEPESKTPVEPILPGGEEQAAQAAQAIEALSAAAGIADVEKERNSVLRSIQQISARVTEVLPNGNMVILGEKVDYRQQNNVRYVTKIRGIIRPEDVSPSNEVSALKLARSEVNTKRQVQREKLNLSVLAPLLGRGKTRLLKSAQRATRANSNNRTTAIPTQ
ncbi:MAG: flagellar biosynthesis protein FlgH [SAR324 cluster bacterium]|uniref:Flagellar biosynthesis protein FlgH n=1 Tax=SAR324 cluster bacterium TaxID=2024889 RepID=A0A2A4T8C4_9DELT|nr:MAG: flagellar biosynthesis protein FlgH [SAR324 cluster bacterium]